MWEGNNDLSFLINGKTSDMWKTGKMLLVLGRSSVTVELLVMILIILYGPSYLGINLMTHF